MIPQKTRHNLRSVSRTLKGYYMFDEVHLVCDCGYSRAIPLTIKREFDGDGTRLTVGDIHAEHVFRNKVYD